MGYSIRKAVEITGCKKWQAHEAQKKHGTIDEAVLDELRQEVEAADVAIVQTDGMTIEQRQAVLELQKIKINKQEIRKRQLEIEELEGRLIPVADAIAISGGRFRSLRDGLLAIPRRVTDQVLEAAKRDDRLEVVRILNDAITAVLLASKNESFVAQAYESADDDEAVA